MVLVDLVYFLLLVIMKLIFFSLSANLNRKSENIRFINNAIRLDIFFVELQINWGLFERASVFVEHFPS